MWVSRSLNHEDDEQHHWPLLVIIVPVDWMAAHALPTPPIIDLNSEGFDLYQGRRLNPDDFVPQSLREDFLENGISLLLCKTWKIVMASSSAFLMSVETSQSLLHMPFSSPPCFIPLLYLFLEKAKRENPNVNVWLIEDNASIFSYLNGEAMLRGSR